MDGWMDGWMDERGIMVTKARLKKCSWSYSLRTFLHFDDQIAI